MKKRHIFTIIFPTFLVIIFVSISIITLIFSNVIYNSYISAVKDKLYSTAYSLSPLIENRLAKNQLQNLDTFITRLANKTCLRISVLAENKKILIDSEKKNSKIQSKLLKSKTDKPSFLKNNDEILHFSLPLIHNNHQIGTLRISKNINDIKHRIYASYIYIACVGFAVAGLAAVLAFFNAKSITGPLEKLKTNASFISSGKNKFNPINSNIIEISDLSESISTMSSCLQNQIDEISDQKNKLNIILANMKEGIVAIDANSNIITMNASAKNILNIKIQTLNTSPFRNLSEKIKNKLHPLSNTLKNDELIQFAEKILKKKTKMQQQLTIIVNDNIRIIDVHGEILKNHSGQFVGSLMVINDITKLKQLEEMRKNFASNVSHELKTPLTAIKGAVETLLDGACNIPETNERFLNMIKKHCDRLTNLINDTMSIARLERENEVLEPIENFKILTFIEHSLDLFKEKISKKHIKIETICNSSIEIRANFNLLGQALVNLIDNAIKFTPEHGTILISAEKKNNEVILSVTDYGSGIPHEHIPHIFERFYRVDTGRSRREGGTGLGLAIVKHIAQVHNGSVKVISIPDQKTIFSIHLPKTQTEL